MKQLFFLLLFAVSVVHLAPTEARVLPAGTSFVLPGESLEVLSEPSFLLSRDDMEFAVMESEEKKLLEKDYSFLKEKYLDMKTLAILGVGGAILGTLLGFLLGTLVP